MTHVLLVDAWMPNPTTDSASLRMCEMMSLLREMDCSVTFIPDDLAAARGARSLLAAQGVRVLGSPELDSIAAHLADEGHDYDIILLSRVYVAEKHFRDVKKLAPGAAVIFDTVDLHYLRLFRWAKVKRNGFLLRQSMEYKSKELWLASEADLTLVVSPYERELLTRECPAAPVLVVPTIHRVDDVVPPYGSRDGLLFIGAFSHQPNEDAVHYLLHEIWPALRQRLPGIGLRIAGPDPPDWVLGYQSKGVEVLGHVPLLEPELNRARLSVAPMRYGAGVNGKVLLSMGHGLPVVGSSVVTEGIPAEAGLDLLVADDPEQFCAAVDFVYSDENAWNGFSINGRRFVKKHFTPQAVGEQLREMLKRLGKHL